MNLQEQILRDEGNVPYAYDDATADAIVPGYTLTGNPTIGVGFLISAPMRDHEVNYILKHRLKEVTDSVDHTFPWVTELSEERRAVFYNMAYNMGVPTLSQFTNTLKAARKHDWSSASRHMKDSHWYHQVTNRADRLIEQLLTNTWV